MITKKFYLVKKGITLQLESHIFARYVCPTIRVGKNPGFFKKTQKPGFFKKNRVLLGFFGFYWVLLGFFGFFWVFLKNDLASTVKGSNIKFEANYR